MTTPIAQEKIQEQHTYADYLQWDTTKRYELIEGAAVLLAAPSTSHQRVSGEIHRQMLSARPLPRLLMCGCLKEKETCLKT